MLLFKNGVPKGVSVIKFQKIGTKARLFGREKIVLTRPNMKNETLLYGRKIGSEPWEEIILCSIPEKFEQAKVLAARDGFGHFRVAEIDLQSPPDFVGTLNAKNKKTNKKKD